MLEFRVVKDGMRLPTLGAGLPEAEAVFVVFVTAVTLHCDLSRGVAWPDSKHIKRIQLPSGSKRD